MSAYFFYASAMRKKIQEENPDAAFGDVTKVSLGICVVKNKHNI